MASGLEAVVNIADLRALARKRLPRMDGRHGHHAQKMLALHGGHHAGHGLRLVQPRMGGHAALVAQPVPGRDGRAQR